jgi:hypothetical protein
MATQAIRLKLNFLFLVRRDASFLVLLSSSYLLFSLSFYVIFCFCFYLDRSFHLPAGPHPSNG